MLIYLKLPHSLDFMPRTTRAPGTREPLSDDPRKFLEQYRSAPIVDLILAIEEVMQDVGRKQNGIKDAQEFDRKAEEAILNLISMRGKRGKELRERLHVKGENGSVSFEIGGITYRASQVYIFVNPKTAKPTINGLLRELGFDPQEYSDLNPWLLSDLMKNSPDPNAAELRKRITGRNLMKLSMRIQITGARESISPEDEPFLRRESTAEEPAFVPASELLKGKKQR